MVGYRTALFLLLWIFLGCSHLGEDRLSSHIPEYSIHRDILANGMTVLFVEDHVTPVVGYASWFRVGSSFEKRGSTGIAHLFEHLMFKGTPKYGPKVFLKNLESKGAIVNAYTQRDATVYYEIAASSELGCIIDMEADRLKNLVFTQQDLDSERKVVLEERRLRVESNFSAQQLEVLEKLAFPNHPYGWPVIGYPEDLKQLGLKEIQKFFKTYYQPKNLVLVVAGDFDYEQTKKKIEEAYGNIEGQKPPKLKLEAQQVQKRELFKIIEKPVQVETVLTGYRIPSMYDPDAETLSLLSWALFNMASSRANIELVRKKQIALNVRSDVGVQRFPSLMLIEVEARKGISYQVVQTELDKLIEEAKQKPFSEQELKRVKNKLRYSTIEETKTAYGLANWLAIGEFYHNDYNYFFKLLERYEKITAEELQRVARKYLNKENRVVVVMKPEATAYVRSN